MGLFTVDLSPLSKSSVFVSLNDGAVEEDDFINLLPKLLSKLKQEGKTTVWLSLSPMQLNLVKYAEKEGFCIFSSFWGNVIMRLSLLNYNHNPQPDASVIAGMKQGKKKVGSNFHHKRLVKGDRVDKFHVSFDAAGGVNINIIDDMNGNAFTTLLQTSISQGRQQGMTHVWLNLPTELENLRKLADKEGFHLRDGSLGTHRLLYAIPQTNHNPQPNVSHVVDIKQGDDNIASANTREENEFELSDIESVALNRRALYMLPAKDNTGLVLYVLFIWLTVVLLRTFNQAAEPILQNKIMLEVSCGSLFGNMVVAALAFAYGRDKPKNKGISFIFNLTLAIPLYLGYSMLIPECYSWIGFPVICIILTIAEFHEKVRKMFQVVF